MTVPQRFERLYPSPESEKCIGTDDRSELLHVIKEAVVTHSTGRKLQRSTDALNSRTAFLRSTGTAMCVLVPFAFTAPILSSTITVNPTTSSLTAKAQTSSGGSDFWSPREVIHEPAFPVLDSLTATSAIRESVSRVSYGTTGNYLRTITSFDAAMELSVASVVAPDEKHFAIATGEVFFQVTSASDLKASYLLTLPQLSDDDQAFDALTYRFQVILKHVPTGDEIFNWAGESGSADPLNLDDTATLIGGDEYQFSYLFTMIGSIGDEPLYASNLNVGFELVPSSGPTPIPLPSSVSGGLALLSLATLRRPARR